MLERCTSRPDRPSSSPPSPLIHPQSSPARRPFIPHTSNPLPPAHPQKCPPPHNAARPPLHAPGPRPPARAPGAHREKYNTRHCPRPALAPRRRRSRSRPLPPPPRPLPPPLRRSVPRSAAAVAASKSSAAPDADTEEPSLLGSGASVLRARLARAQNATTGGLLGNMFCVMQPTLSAGRDAWRKAYAMALVALRAFLRTFTDAVTEAKRASFRLTIYYGHDSDGTVFGDVRLRASGCGTQALRTIGRSYGSCRCTGWGGRVNARDCS